MGEIQWIKLSTDFFGDDKIKQIRAMPEGDAMVLVWLNLLVMAGKTNDGGLIYLTKELPYNDEMFSIAMNRPVGIVRAAINIFKTLHMVEDTPDGLLISNWEKHQNIDGMERAREQSKLRMRNYRERKRLEAGQKEDCYVTVTQQVTPCSADVTHQNKNKKEDIEEDIELELRDKFNNNNKGLDNTDAVEGNNDTVSVDVQAAAAENDPNFVCTAVGKAWNRTGFTKVRSFPVASARGKAIWRLVGQYGLETVLAAIEKTKDSEFLRELGDRVTLDWFLQAEHFQKVLEGQYDRKWERRSGETKGTSSADRIRAMIERGEFKE